MVRERQLPFSFFPVTRGTRRYGLFDTLFAVSPWAVMRAAVSDSVAVPTQRDEAQAFLEQASDFYNAATTRAAANPLLYYYAFLNIGKALLRTRGFGGSLDQAMHGLTAATTIGGVELQDSAIIVRDSPGLLNLYPEFVARLGFPRPANGASYPIPDLLAQIVVGHRVWRQATRSKERFISIEEIEIVCDSMTRELWLRLYLGRGDLSRYEITRAQLLREVEILPANSLR